MRLYQLERDKGVKLKLPLSLNGGDEKDEFVTFHHTDGLYSFCTVDSLPKGKNVVHLGVMTKLKPEGDYYILDEDQSTDDDDLPTQDEKRKIV